MKRFLSRAVTTLSVLALGAGLVFGASAMAEQAPDRVVADQILSELAATPPADQGVVSGPVAEAKKALERAKGARGSGDVHHAEQLEGLAREWAETARDLVRAAGAEADAGAMQLAAADAATQSERARALLEEAIARRGRAGAELERAQAEAAEQREAPAKPGKAQKAQPKGEAKPKAEPKKADKPKPAGAPKKGGK